MPKPVALPSREELLKFLSYDPASGVLRWTKKPSKNKLIGEVAGKPQKPKGYVQVGFNGRIYLAHRIAWLIHFGEEPPDFIDHINMNPSDNRIENLRSATNSRNMQNARGKGSNTGLKGVHKAKSSGRFLANICTNNKRIYLGSFATAEEAHAAYCRAAKELHGPYARTE